MKRFWLWAPLLLFIGFFGIMASGLFSPGERAVASGLVNKPLPRFSLPSANPGQPGLGSANMADGRPKLLNFFASWCVPCAAEAPQLMALRRAGIDVDAIAIRDRPADVARFLKRYGNPYGRIGSDVDSNVQIALGSSGVPETFIVDGNGVIRYQHIGDIRAEDVAGLITRVRRLQ